MAMKVVDIPSHAKPPEGIELRPSKVDKRQIGAWCLEAVKQGTLFGPFKGDIVYENDRKKIDFRFAWEVYDLDTNELVHIVNATDPGKGNWTRFVNCARYLEEQNLVSIQEGMQVYYKAIRDIPAGEELLTWFERSKIKENRKIRSPDGEAKTKGTAGTGSPKKRKVKRTKSDSSLGLGVDVSIGEKRQRKKKKLFDDEEVSFSNLIPKKRKKRNSRNSVSSLTGEQVSSIESVVQNLKNASNVETSCATKKKAKGGAKKLKGNKAAVEGDMKNFDEAEKEKFKEIEKNWRYPSGSNEYQFELSSKFAISMNNRRMYKCDICGGLYRHTFSLKRHYLRNHINCSYLSKADIANCMIVIPLQHLAILKANEGKMLGKIAKQLAKYRSMDEDPDKKNEDKNPELNEKLPGLYRCNVCSKLFDEVEDLIKHTEDHPELPDAKTFACSLCNMTFRFKMNLVRHQLVHEGKEKPQTKKKPKLEALPPYNVTGDPKKPFGCSQCSMKFKYSTNLMKHKVVHSDNRPCLCTVCGKSFPTQTNLKKHINIHIGCKVPCKYCDVIFSHVGGLRKHIRISHPEIHRERLLKLLEKRGKLGTKAARALENSYASEKAATVAKNNVEAIKKEHTEIEKEVKIKKEKKTKMRSDDEIDTKFKYACTICKKRFTEYVNMCRHRRIAHKNQDKPMETTNNENLIDAKVEDKREMDTTSVKSEISDDPIVESSEDTAEFYANVAYNIAENLNSYIDGGQDALANSRTHLRFEDLSSGDGQFADDKEVDKIPWDQYNFPQNYNPTVLLENFEYCPMDPDEHKKYQRETPNYFDVNIDENSLDDRGPALCTRRRSSRESKDDSLSRDSFGGTKIEIEQVNENSNMACSDGDHDIQVEMCVKDQLQYDSAKDNDTDKIEIEKSGENIVKDNDMDEGEIEKNGENGVKDSVTDKDGIEKCGENGVKDSVTDKDGIEKSGENGAMDNDTGKGEIEKSGENSVKDNNTDKGEIEKNEENGAKDNDTDNDEIEKNIENKLRDCDKISVVKDDDAVSVDENNDDDDDVYEDDEDRKIEVKANKLENFVEKKCNLKDSDQQKEMTDDKKDQDEEEKDEMNDEAKDVNGDINGNDKDMDVVNRSDTEEIKISSKQVIEDEESETKASSCDVGSEGNVNRNVDKENRDTESGMSTRRKHNSESSDGSTSGILLIDLFEDSDSDSQIADPDTIFQGLDLAKGQIPHQKMLSKEKKDGDIVSSPQHSPLHNFDSFMFGKNGQVAYVCSVCKRHYPDYDRLIRHQWKKHPSINCHFLEVEQGHEIESLYYSQPCSRGLLGATGKALENAINRSNYTCSRCKGTFKSVDRLRVHIINCATPMPSPKKRKYRKRTPTKFDVGNTDSMLNKDNKLNIKELNSKVKELAESQAASAKENGEKIKKEENDKGEVTDIYHQRKQSVKSEGDIEITDNQTKDRHDDEKEKPDEIGSKTKVKRKMTKHRKRKASSATDESKVNEMVKPKRKKSTDVQYNPRNHVRRRELTEVLDKQQCKGCGVKFKTISLLERHIKKCDEKEKFKDLKVMKSTVNEMFHQKQKHTCFYCSKAFIYPKTLMNHYRAFCLIKKEKEKKGLLSDVDRKEETSVMTRLKQQEEDRKFTNEFSEVTSGPKKGWPRGVKRKNRRKNHSWTYIKKRSVKAKAGKIAEDGSAEEIVASGNKQVPKVRYLVSPEKTEDGKSVVHVIIDPPISKEKNDTKKMGSCKKSNCDSTKKSPKVFKFNDQKMSTGKKRKMKSPTGSPTVGKVSPSPKRSYNKAIRKKDEKSTPGKGSKSPTSKSLKNDKSYLSPQKVKKILNFENPSSDFTPGKEKEEGSEKLQNVSENFLTKIQQEVDSKLPSDSLMSKRKISNMNLKKDNKKADLANNSVNVTLAEHESPTEADQSEVIQEASIVTKKKVKNITTKNESSPKKKNVSAPSPKKSPQKYQKIVHFNPEDKSLTLKGNSSEDRSPKKSRGSLDNDVSTKSVKSKKMVENNSPAKLQLSKTDAGASKQATNGGNKKQSTLYNKSGKSVSSGDSKTSPKLTAKGGKKKMTSLEEESPVKIENVTNDTVPAKSPTKSPTKSPAKGGNKKLTFHIYDYTNFVKGKKKNMKMPEKGAMFHVLDEKDFTGVGYGPKDQSSSKFLPYEIGKRVNGRGKKLVPAQSICSDLVSLTSKKTVGVGKLKGLVAKKPETFKFHEVNLSGKEENNSLANDSGETKAK